MSANGEVGESKNQRTEPQQSLRSNASDTSLTSTRGGVSAEPIEASPQSFAALKQAFDYMLPQFKALQTENRTLNKEKEELRKKLTEKEASLSLDMSDRHSQEFSDDLRSKGQSANRRTVSPLAGYHTETANSENAEECRVSPCGGSDSPILLNNGDGGLSAEKEREFWLPLTFQLLLHLPEDKLRFITGISEHCLRHLEDSVLKTDDRNRGLVATKLIKLRNSSGVSDESSQMRTSQSVTPQEVTFQMGLLNHGDEGTIRRSPTGKSLPISSDEDPSDEDIYTSGYPTKRRGMKHSEADEDDDEGHEWVRVENAVDVLEKCASYIHHSLEVHEILRKKLEDSSRGTESLGKLSRRDEGLGSSIGAFPPDLPPPPVPARGLPPAVPTSQVRPSPRRIDTIRQQYPSTASTASDPGRASPVMSHLARERHFFSDPVVVGDPRYNSPKKARRPRSAAETLQELSVKYPPLPYGAGAGSFTGNRNYSDSQRPSQQQMAHHDFGPQQMSPITIDQNSFHFNDGQTYQPRGPPEPDFNRYEAAAPPEEEDEDFESWNAARNPDMMFQQAPSSPRYSRSDPTKRFPPGGSGGGSSSGGHVGDSYGQPGQLPRSSDRIYDMGPASNQLDTLTMLGGPGTREGGWGPRAEGPECPVCNKRFDPTTPGITVQSHVNLHFENEKNQFEIIE